MNLFGSLMIAFSMYSAIPTPQVEWTKERMKYVMCFFPLIGIVIGVLNAYLPEVSEYVKIGKMGMILIGTALPLLITGGIHMDGFLDVTDARRSFAEREKKLEILKDPHTGAFAIIGFGVYLLLYAAFFSELSETGMKLFAFAFVISRSLSGLAVVSFPMAKKDGLAAAFSESAVKKRVRVVMVAYLVLAEVVLLFLHVRMGIGIFLTSLAVYGYYYRMSLREFGGMTGDLAGYFLQNCELAILIFVSLLGKFWL